MILENGALRVLLTGLRDSQAPPSIGEAVRAMLAREGIVVAVRVAEVERLERGATGKAPLIVAR